MCLFAQEPKVRKTEMAEPQVVETIKYLKGYELSFVENAFVL